MQWECDDRFSHDDQSNVLADAIKNCRFRQAQLLVANGSHVNARDSYQRTPLILVSIYLTGYDNWYNRDRFARLLLQHRADPNLSDCFGLTPLIHAAINGQTDYVQILLSDARTDYQIQDKAGNNALMLSAGYGQVQVVRLLAEHVSQDMRQTAEFVDRRNNDDKCAEELAADGDHLECVSILRSLKESFVRRQHTDSVANHLNSSLVSNKVLIGDGLKSLAGRSHIKSHENLSIANVRSVARNGVKLPPINGKRFVDYSDWNKQKTNDTNDRKTI